MHTVKKTTQILVENLNNTNLIEKIENYSGRFYDEPRHFYFGTTTSKEYVHLDTEDYYYHNKQSMGVGISFHSEHRALLKSIAEAIERFSMQSIPKKEIKFKRLDKTELNESTFFKLESNIPRPLNGANFGWINGSQLTPNEKIRTLIPAQLIYLDSYFSFIKDKGLSPEPILAPVISTGAAAHYSIDSAVLNGIYELIERDALMSIYLNRIPLNYLKLESIPYTSVQSILKKCKRYLLQPYIFEIYTDLKIPVIMTIIVDKTGLGPSAIVGSSCSFDIEKAMVHSLEEALSFRFLVRRKMNEKKTTIFNIPSSEIIDNTTMQLFWSSPLQLKNLDFLLKQPPVDFLFPKEKQREDSLKDIIKLCHQLSFPLYFIDITPPIVKKIGLYVVRVLMPSLQPLYIDQTKKFFNIKRLKYVSKLFNKKKFSLNSIPHPIP